VQAKTKPGAMPTTCYRPRDDIERFSPSIVPLDRPSAFEPYLRLASRRVYPHGHTIIQQGAFVGGVYYLTRGRVRYSILSSDGRVKTVALLEPGNTIGEGPTILGRPCAFNVSAVTDCEAYFFPAALLNEMLDTDPAVSRMFLYSLARKLRTLAAQVSDLTFLDARTRVTRLLDTLSRQHGVRGTDGLLRLGLKLSHSEIAQIAGNNRVTVTAVLSDLQKLGCIEVGKKSITIVDADRLAALAAPAQMY